MTLPEQFDDQPEVREYLDSKRTWTAPVKITRTETRDDSDELIVEGYAAVFDSDSEPIAGMFIERMQRGAFKRTLAADPDVRLMVNHAGLALARTANATLALEERPRGLFFRAQLPDTPTARELHTLVQRGDMDQCSFAFTVAEDRWIEPDKDSSDLPRRTITRIGELFEVSVVTFPAYASTSVIAGERSAERSDAGSEQQASEPAVETDCSSRSASDPRVASLRARRLKLAHRRRTNVPGPSGGS